MSRFPFPPYPDGWFQVACSDDLAPGAVRSLSYFGRRLVLFRTAAGAARVLDGHCPHLGADLGVGGEVIGDTLRCPFHGWCFDGDGACVSIPYARKIPPLARTRAWPVSEQNGMILVSHHAAGEPVPWQVPRFPEYDAADWTPFVQRTWTIRTRNQEVFENTVDGPHLHYVHGLLTVPRTAVKSDGPRLHTRHDYKMMTPRGPADMTLEATAYGLGVQAVRISGFARVLIVMTPTPIDDDRLELRLSFSAHAGAGAAATRVLGDIVNSSIERELEEDIPIWENKDYRARPVLCDGDAPIGVFRRWARQFYSSVGDPAQHRPEPDPGA